MKKKNKKLPVREVTLEKIAFQQVEWITPAQIGPSGGSLLSTAISSCVL
jgi:hypothetical protein